MSRLLSFLIAAGIVAVTVSLPFNIFADFDPCQTCDFIVGRAEHHFKPNETATQLQARLDFECQQLGHFQGQNASDHCKKIIDNNIQTIYSDIKAGKRPQQICFDFGECTSPSGAPPTWMPPSGAPRAEVAPEVRAPPQDPCRTCAFIVGRAEHHFKPNETSDQLKGHLENECKQLAQLQGQQAADHCTQIIDANIQTIYDDIKAGKRPHQICTDIGECAASSGAPPSGAPKADILARPHDPCRTCEFIIGRAEYHIHNGNITDENRLLRELEHECIQLAHTEGDQASVACLNIIQKDIDMIFNDIKAGKRPRQICEDMGECHQMTGGTGAPPTTGGPIPVTTPPSSFFKKLNIFH